MKSNTLLLVLIIICIVLIIRKIWPSIKNLGHSEFNNVDLSAVDYMDGHDFEYWCADLLRHNGFSNVRVTQGSGDQGVDILAQKDKRQYAIQCKRYSKSLGNRPIQEVNTGKTIYGCTVAAVMTNQYFTKGAVDAARAVGVQLWDRDVLSKMLEQKNKRINGKGSTLNLSHHEADRHYQSVPKAVSISSTSKKQTHSTQSYTFTTHTTVVQPGGSSLNGTRRDNQTPYSQLLAESQKRIDEHARRYKMEMDQARATEREKKEREYANNGIVIPESESIWFEQAVTAAKSCLESFPYSRIELIESLITEGFTKDQAVYGVDNSGANWNEQAALAAKDSLDSYPSSKQELIEELEYSWFTPDQAVYGVEHCNRSGTSHTKV